MNGPINEDVFPIIENKEKNRNSLPLGQTSEIILLLVDSQRGIHTSDYMRTRDKRQDRNMLDTTRLWLERTLWYVPSQTL